MDSNIISGLIGFIGVLVGALVAWITSNLIERRRNAIGLYDTFTSLNMETVRHEGGKYIESNLKLPQPLSFCEMHNLETAQELLLVSQLLHFWERTFRLIEVGYAEERLTRKLLEHYFVSHYQSFLFEFCRVCEERGDPLPYRKWIEATFGLASRWKVSPS